MAKTNKYSIINNEMFLYELEPFVIENVPSGIDTIYVQEEKYSEFKQLNPSLPLAKKNYLLLCANTPIWYSDYQRVMELPDIASPELSFSESEVEVNVYEVPCTVALQAVTNPHGVDVVYSVDGVEVLDPSACEISTDGSHTVTASFAGNDYYYSMEVSYALTINIVEDTMDISFANSEVSVSSYLDESWTGQLQPVVGAPSGATIVYSCEGGVIANGDLTLPTAGTYTVNVEVSATHYTTATASYDIVYTQDYRTMNISFAVDSVGVSGNQGESWTGTVQAVSGAPANSSIVYSCNDQNVTINGTSISIADEGTYTISATVSAQYYNDATITYSIVYSQIDLVMNLSFAESAISETINSGDGYESQLQEVIGTPQGSSVVYSCSDGSISNGAITVSNISNGDVVTVTATVSCTDYVTTTVSYTITFTVLEYMNVSFESSEVSVSTYVDETYTGVLQSVTGTPTGALVTYSTEDAGATIANGQITLSSEGTYTVTAEITYSGYVDETLSYDIVYTKNNRTMSVSFASNSVSVDSYADENYSGTLQAVTGAPANSSIVYSCSDNAVTISGTSVSITTEGTYTISATISCQYYNDATITYSIVYTKNNRTMSVSFASNSVSVDSYADENYSGTLQAVTGAPANSSIVYSCSDNAVTISGTSVSISAAGTYTVSATVSCQYYNDATITYSIVYTKNNRTMSLSFTNSAISETISGDSYSAQVQSVTGSPQGATVVYSTSDGSISNGTLTVSSISDGDVVTVTATVSATGYTTATASYTITFTVLSQKSNLNVSFAQNEYNYSPLGPVSVESIIGIPNDYDGTITWDYSTDEVNWTPVQNDLIGDIEVEEVYVRATLPDTSLYNGTQIQYTVTRWTDYADILWEGTGITSTTFYFDSEDNPSFPVSVTPIDALTTNGVSVDSITSSDTSILEIDSNTGEWILKQEGTVTMTATVYSSLGHEYRMRGDSKDLTVTIDIVSGRVETQFMQSSASDVNMIEYVESDLTQSQLPYTITISDVYLQTTQGTAVTLSDSSLIVHDCGPDFSFDNDNNEVTYTAWQLSDMVQATLTFKGDATYKPCSATVYIELNEVILPSYTLSYTYDDTNMTATCTGADDTTLTDIEIPAQVEYNGDTYDVTSVGANAFMQYSSLRNLTLHEGLLTIESQAFKEPDIYYLVIPDSVTTIGNSAFWSGSDYHTITFGTGLTSVGGSNFVNCQIFITDIYCRMSTPFTIASYTFYGLSKGNITLHVPVGSLATYQADSWWGSGWSSIVDDIVIS